MLATSGGFQVLIGVAIIVVAALVVYLPKAAVTFTRKRQRAIRDNQSLTEFLFDTPENTRTRVPAREGWTTKVDRMLDTLVASNNRTEAAQLRTERAVQKILGEVTPDGNGGHNLRGEVRRAATAQSEERDRVHRNEDGQ